MKKLLSLIFSLLLLTAVLSGCGADSGLDDKISHLEEQLALLDGRVAALEAENAALKARLEADTAMDAPVSDLPTEDTNAFAPTAEFIFGDWTVDEDILTLSEVFARVAGLTMLDGSIAEIYGCDLVLYWGGMELSKEPLTMYPGEAADSFELELDQLQFALPDFSEGDQLELTMELTLFDGTVLTIWGGSWEYLEGELIMIAG